jgi:hypothetical protein
MKHLQIYESFPGRPLPVEDDPKIKDGVDSLFEKFPQLARVGTPAQYSQYLDTIFPNSKVKDILYHSSPSKFTRFKDPASSGLSHIWFSEEPLDSQFGSNVYPVIVNLQNPLMQNHPDYNKGLRSFESPLNPDWVNKEMICEVDNSIAFESAATDMFQLVSSGQLECAGPLYKILQPQNF